MYVLKYILLETLAFKVIVTAPKLKYVEYWRMSKYSSIGKKKTRALFFFFHIL